MALSRIVYPGDGVTVQFSIPFALGYLKQADIQCRVGDEVDGGGDPLYRTLTFDTATLVTISGAAPAIGQDVVFTRTVDAETLLVDFEDGSVLNEANLNASQLQMIMLVHQVLDGRFDTFQTDLNMADHRIINLLDPVDDQDAATKAYVLSTSPTVGAAADAGELAGAAAAEAVLADKLDKDQNLSDVASVGLARANLGLGSIATQDANNVVITGGSISMPTLILKQSAAPVITAEGEIQWDTDDDILVIGTGAAQRMFVPVPASMVAGDLLYATSDRVLARLPKGTSRQMLEMNAAASNLQWGRPAKERLLTSGSLSNAANLSVPLTAYAAEGYREYQLAINDFIPVTDAVEAWFRTSSNGGTTYDFGASEYRYNTAITTSTAGSGSTTTEGSTGAAQIKLQVNVGNAGSTNGGGISALIRVLDPAAARKTRILYETIGFETTSMFTGRGAGMRTADADVDALRVQMSSGNIASGTWALYGVL